MKKIDEWIKNVKKCDGCNYLLEMALDYAEKTDFEVCIQIKNNGHIALRVQHKEVVIESC